VRVELNRRVAKMVGEKKAREMESHLDAVTQMFADVAADS
jgi:hypothetical protein